MSMAGISRRGMSHVISLNEPHLGIISKGYLALLYLEIQER